MLKNVPFCVMLFLKHHHLQGAGPFHQLALLPMLIFANEGPQQI
jgi:hypothetical protein